MLKKVLVLDNDPRILEVMEEVLRYEGFEVKTFEGTDDILPLVKQHKPDLLIIDYILDGVNGGEHCRRVKNYPVTCKLPVIIISAYPKVFQSLGHYGCNAFIAKPFNLSVLMDKVNELISSIPKMRINTQLNGY
ncbi:response regulator [Mucilaginibacter arboris]|uniref:Response regulator n=1 Tax=Mucilaginibacter arboris TaxID=2682090 RepID=A0A7K1SYI5_9SPHI|nr:response regulator [Mucilaginibacter arboris]MVN22371.1 response regulator [Mucilaginibacter arboris]